MVTVLPSVLPQVDAGEETELVCTTPTLLTSTGDQGDDFSHQWFYLGDSIPGANSPTVFAIGLGTHSILTTNNVTGCMNIDSVQVVASAEFPEVRLQDTTGILTCAIDSVIITPQITPANGNYSFTNIVDGEWTVTVDTDTLPPGLTATGDDDGVGEYLSRLGLATLTEPPTLDKAALIAEAEADGIKVDKRLDAEGIAAQIAEARASTNPDNDNTGSEGD